MIVEGELYNVTIKVLYIDDDSNKLVIKGEIYDKTKKESHDFEKYITLALDEPNIDIYDN